MSPKTVWLKNILGDQINPSTYDAQTDGTQKTQISASLPAGTNIIGKVGIDQTTPGTTNKVIAELRDGFTSTAAKVDGLGNLKIVEQARLIGTAFSGTVKDTNFWTETVTGSGAVAQAGEITLTTGVTANSTAKYVTVRKARKVTGAANQFRMVGRLTTDPQANNLRRAGAYDANNGFFFQVDGTTFGVGVRKGGADTIVNSGSFNGNMGASVTLTTTFGRFFIEYDHLSVKFFMNDVLLHTITATTTALTNTLDLNITMENNNSGGNTTDNAFELLFAAIVRLGKLETNTQCYYAGTNATTVLKYGAGQLIRITVTDNTGTLIAYDNTAGSGNILGNIDASKTTGTLEFDCPFNNGLTIVTAGTPKMTVVYE